MDGWKEGWLGERSWYAKVLSHTYPFFPPSLPPSLPPSCSSQPRPSTTTPTTEKQQKQQQQQKEQQQQQQQQPSKKKGPPPTPSPKAPTSTMTSTSSSPPPRPRPRPPSHPPSLPSILEGGARLICFIRSILTTFTLYWRVLGLTHTWKGWTWKITCFALTEVCFG